MIEEGVGGEDFDFACPWCGEPNELFIDPQERGQMIVMDCRVCCRPIELDVPHDPGMPPDVRPEDQ